MKEKSASLTTHLRGAFELGKWKVRLGRLRKERRGHEQQRAEAVTALGARAWQHQDWQHLVHDEAFAAIWSQLTELERQHDEVGKEAEGLEASRAEMQAEKERLEAHHGQVVAEAEAQLKTAEGQLRAATSLRKEWEKTRQRIQSQEKSTGKALASARDRMQKAGADPGGAAQLDGLQREIAEAERTLAELAAKLRETEQGIPQRLSEESHRQQEVDQRKEGLDGARKERVQALQPVEESLRQLGEQLATIVQQQAGLAARKADALAQLGARVAAARPSSEALAEDYRRIDAHDAELARTDQEISTLEHRITTSGPGARRAFYAAWAVLALVVVGAGYLAASHYGFSLPGPSVEGDVAVRVADAAGESVVGASTVLFFEGGPVAQYTDIHGAATLALDGSRGRRGRLVVEADGFRIHEQELQLKSGLVDVRLEPPAPEMADVVVRSLDSSTHEPVAGAEVLVLAGADTFSQVTDSHGISKFTLAFHDTKVDVQMSVESKGYGIEHQRVTLLPDRVQDVNLDRAAAQLAVVPFDVEEALVRNFRDAEDDQLKPGTRATGALRAGTSVKYTFPGHRNTPILFTVQRTDGELYYDVLFHDEKDFQVEEDGSFGGGVQRLAFTPQVDGEHGLYVRGVQEGGSYAVTMAYLSGPPEKRNTTRSLTLERSEKGMLAVGSFDDFEFQGAANEPVIVKIQRASGSLYYGVEVYDAEDTLLAEHGQFASGTQDLPFTPAKAGTYRVRIRGFRDYGRYTLAMSRLGDQGNQVLSLELGESHKGELAAGAYDDYRFQGHRNTPLLLTLQRSSGSLYYRLAIFDSQNRQLVEHGSFASGTQEIPFTPQADGEYRLRVYGTQNFGRYVLSRKLLNGPPEERNRIQPLEPEGNYTGTIGAGAYDEYSVSGHAGQPLTLTFQRQSGSFYYRVEVFDAEGKELENQGWFGSGLERIGLTPPADGTYRVRVTANEGFGSYVIGLNDG